MSRENNATYLILPLDYHYLQCTKNKHNSNAAGTSGDSLGPIHSCSDCNTKACSILAAEDNDDGVVGFLSF